MEAFLFCVDSDRESHASERGEVADLQSLERRRATMTEAKKTGATVLVPRMGVGSDVAVAALRGEGFVAECLPLSTRRDVREGRRHTSGKECVPMMLTAGTLLGRLERARHTSERFVFFMPTAKGPCRFGVYSTLHKIILEETGWAERVKIVSPDDADYFREMSADFSLRLWVGFVARDLLEMMLQDVRPVERERGAAQAIVDRATASLLEAMEHVPAFSLASTVRQIFGGLWGVRDILSRAASELAAAKDTTKRVPTIAVVGEIYVRLDPFANDEVVAKLEARGLRARLAPFVEWLEYSTHIAQRRLAEGALRRDDDPTSIALGGIVQQSLHAVLYDLCAGPLGWGRRMTVRDSLGEAKRYLSPELQGEAALTIGGPVFEFGHGEIQGVIIVGPHECMPCKIAEAQYGEVAEHMKLPYLSIAYNGDPMDEEAIDRFAYDVHDAFGPHKSIAPPRLVVRAPAGRGVHKSNGRVRLPIVADAEE
jgi:predicted nucleotide-binding protein (sugar kinase/HSP70/actin superfamily)